MIEIDDMAHRQTQRVSFAEARSIELKYLDISHAYAPKFIF